MKHLWISAIFLLVGCGSDNNTTKAEPTTPAPPATTAFARGADISWYTEMKADGRKFYNDQGEERSLPRLMTELGTNAVRFRVWVNPENKGSNYNNTADVVAKAVEANRLGMDVMIDFHYSDWWADPSRQDIPEAWAGHAFSALQEDVRNHTADVLRALKTAGVSPKWVQVGNETNNGMLGEMGTTAKPKQYAALFKAGYEAVKSIFPETLVMPHLAKGFDSGLFKWNLDLLVNNGAKFDMIGMSVYPTEFQYWDKTKQSHVNTTFWSETSLAKVTLTSKADLVEKAFDNIDFVAKRYNCKVMIVETGIDDAFSTASHKVMTDLKEKAQANKNCAGLFFWEPQCDGVWKPAVYETLGWGAYTLGAFSKEGQPAPFLKW